MAGDNDCEKDNLKKLADHVAVLNEEMGVVQVDMAAIKVDLSWVKKLSWWQLGILGSLLLGGLGYILFA